MTDDGILIIEDVQSIHWIKQLCEAVPEDLIKIDMMILFLQLIN